MTAWCLSVQVGDLLDAVAKVDFARAATGSRSGTRLHQLNGILHLTATNGYAAAIRHIRITPLVLSLPFIVVAGSFGHDVRAKFSPRAVVSLGMASGNVLEIKGKGKTLRVPTLSTDGFDGIGCFAGTARGWESPERNYWIKSGTPGVQLDIAADFVDSAEIFDDDDPVEDIVETTEEQSGDPDFVGMTGEDVRTAGDVERMAEDAPTVAQRPEFRPDFMKSDPIPAKRETVKEQARTQQSFAQSPMRGTR